ncbi:DUF104 domain-containing protein [Geitlerinema sp. P-1104]|uniref:DUF104 domain-containing protein n=1 Tax=Geitlerinema sp. P-1104 TaxID=2546230 RepID=UPI0014770415|nr:DUF104 domain-containing protein [Geitlerinema sp. P-1104]NMG61226.1 DUF104 domain-containing protein [Geitlerinema sp. P-1104]
MPNPLKAVYHNGTFVLKTDCHLPEGAEVELWVNSSQLIAPKISDPREKAIFLRSLVEKMQQYPIPATAPELTRESLHERR